MEKILMAGIPAGIVCMIWAVIVIVKSFTNEKVLLEMLLENDCDEFVIEEEGDYSIWLRGPWLSITAPSVFVPVINHVESGEEIILNQSVFRVQRKSFLHGNEYELYHFHAAAGRYLLTVYQRDDAVANLFLQRDVSGQSIVVTKKYRFWRFFFSIWALVIGMFLIMLGILSAFGVLG